MLDALPANQLTSYIKMESVRCGTDAAKCPSLSLIPLLPVKPALLGEALRLVWITARSRSLRRRERQDRVYRRMSQEGRKGANSFQRSWLFTVMCPFLRLIRDGGIFRGDPQGRPSTTRSVRWFYIKEKRMRKAGLVILFAGSVRLHLSF